MKTKRLNCVVEIPLAIFLATTLVVGKCYYQQEGLTYIVSHLCTLIVQLLIYAFLTFVLVNFIIKKWKWFISLTPSIGCGNWIFGKKCFWKVSIILLLVWSPIIVLSFPGNLNADAVRQIEQVLGIVSYSTHHPLFSTLLIGGCVKFGEIIWGTYDWGLFLYVWIQAIALSTALSATLCELKRRRCSQNALLLIMAVYIFCPLYSNIVSTVIKDVPFVVAVIWYMIFWSILCDNMQALKNKRFVIGFVFIQILVILLRNNGIYMLVLSHLFFWIIKRKDCVPYKKWCARCLILLFVPMLMGSVMNSCLFNLLDAYKGSRREMLSLPFQQTARYLSQYKDEISIEEQEAIEAILTDVVSVAKNYDPDIADPVKVLYRDEATLDEHVQYFRYWCKGLMKHPVVYIDAFLAHVYGWFSPYVSNEIRYEAESDIFRWKELFPGSDTLLVNFYQKLDKIPVFGILENVGIYTWILFIMSYYIWRRKRQRIIMFFPLYASLIICMLSPCFFLHPRYAFPIIFTIPFWIGIVSCSNKMEE